MISLQRLEGVSFRLMNEYRRDSKMDILYTAGESICFYIFVKHLVIGIKVFKIFITYPQYKSLKDSRKSDKSTIMYVQRCSSQHYLYQHGIMYINLAT